MKDKRQFFQKTSLMSFSEAVSSLNVFKTYFQCLRMRFGNFLRSFFITPSRELMAPIFNKSEPTNTPFL